MSKPNTLIMGSATGYTFAQIAHFVKSLRGSGYTGDLVLLTHELSPEDSAAFAQYKVTAIPAEETLRRWGDDFKYRRFHGRKWGKLHRSYFSTIDKLPVTRSCRDALLGRANRLFHHIACSRYSYYLQYLKGPGRHYEQVIFADVRDVVFQADPFASLDGVELGFALEPRHYLYGSGTPDDGWLKKLYGESEWETLHGKRTSCCGTLFGTRTALISYLEIMCREMARLSTSIMGYHGFDQAAHNYLWHRGAFGQPTRFENFDGPVFTMGTAKPETIRQNAVGEIINEDGSAIAVLHQFDRHPDLEETLLKKWSEASF